MSDLKIITVDDDGCVRLSRCDYLYRDGVCNEEDERRIGDGSIAFPPKSNFAPGEVDIRDAQEIANWINEIVNDRVLQGKQNADT